MRIKELFTVPDGTKVTERIFTKVLLSSICSILLCMVCLVSTTWAWFTVSIENQGNQIQIAEVNTDIAIEKNGSKVDIDPAVGGYLLDAGQYDIQVKVENNAKGSDNLARPQNDVYVVMTVAHNGSSESYYFTFQGEAKNTQQLKDFQINDGTATVSFSVSWVKPASADPVGSEAIVIGQLPTQPTTEPATEATTLPTEEPSTETTVPEETQTEVTQ